MLRPVPIHRWHLVATTLLVVGALLVGLAPQADSTKVAQVKSAFVVNFVRYTRWPERAFPNDDAPITVAIVGHDPLGSALDDAMKGKTVAGRRIVARRVTLPTARTSSSAPALDADALKQELAFAHVVFVSEQERRFIPELLRELDGEPMLLVSDAPGFCRQGGMLGFVPRDNKLAFEANPKRIDAAQLKVSSKLLKLATIVTEKDE